MGILTQRHEREFFETGFCVVRDVFRDEEIARLRRAFDRLRATALRLGRTAMHRGSRFVLRRGEDDRVAIERIVWCGAAEPVLARFGMDVRLVRMAARLLGSDSMNQLINQAHFKMPGDEVGFPWHQDSSHRRYGGGEWQDVNGRGSYVQTVTAVDDVTPENGPLRLVPGSCRLGHLRPDDGPIEAHVEIQHAVAATMPAGSVLLFGPYTVHGSEPNRSAEPRRTLINGFAYPGANRRVYPGDGAGRLLRLSGGAVRQADSGPSTMSSIR